VLHAKCSVVNIPKRVPPPLPIRSPARASRASKSEFGDVTMLKSPLRQSFNSDDQPQTTLVSAENQEVDVALLEPAAEIRPSTESSSHKHADSQESIATEVASQATPIAPTHPQIPLMEAPQFKEQVGQKKSDEGAESPARVEIVEAEAIKIEASGMAATTIVVS